MRIVVVGTGTGIGKTHVACAIARALTALGNVRGLKPIETGVVAGHAADAARLAEAAGHEVIAPCYAFGPPLSPHLAARRAGQSIALDRVAEWVDARPADAQVIETAGGLLSPLGAGRTNLDLARVLAPATMVVVAADRLGVLHDLAAVLDVLDRRCIAAAAVALSAPETPDASTGTNAAELAALGMAQPIGFPRAGLTDPASAAAAAQLLARLA